jgi:hypothetical protein
MIRAACLLSLAACAGGDPVTPAPVTCADGGVDVAVVTSLRFARITDGVSLGFDLDGDDGGDVGCDKPDVEHPDGTEGIDNALAGVLPILEQTEAAGVEGIAQDNIDNGNLLLMLAMDGLAPADPTCAAMQVFRAKGPPLLGADGGILAGQTLQIDEDLPQGERLSAVRDGDAVHVEGLNLRFPLTIFDANLDLVIGHGQMTLEPTEDGGWKGVWGGGLPWAELVAQLQGTNVDQTLLGTLPTLLGAVADLAPNESGVCQEISLAFEVEATPAWLYEGPSE